ncbi:peroxisomal membrane protein PEX16-like [Saccoglossus kowalevskii]|uniref:Peroxisomal membrane protein PEX16 n=1 Tax=Saccoglossus kowalevskii TaxID=10224 RepID=A0ABM0MNZ9_SACKO|nr:PREDICTED: peroxisomal membrane protein PEX16-like [Saccoglossus kowalevskii]
MEESSSACGRLQFQRVFFAKISAKYRNYCKTYRQWVGKNPEVASQIEHTVKIVSYLIAGRFDRSQELAELVYASSSLLVYINDNILRRASKLKLKLPPRSQYRLMSWLTMIEYIEVFVEIAAKRLWGETGRWIVIVIIQLIKATLRATLLVVEKVGIQSLPPLFPLNREKDIHIPENGDSIEEDELTQSGIDEQNETYEDFEQIYRECDENKEDEKNKAATFVGKRSGRVVRTLNAAPPLLNRTWNLPSTETTEKEEPWSKYLPPTELSKNRIIGESLYIARPLIHLASMFKFGQYSWKPWLLSCGLDLSSLLLMGNSKDLNVNEKAELRRRSIFLLYYLLRSPFYDRYSKARILLALQGLSDKVPLMGLIARPLMEYLPYWQQVYFYNWGY